MFGRGSRYKKINRQSGKTLRDAAGAFCWLTFYVQTSFSIPNYGKEPANYALGGTRVSIRIIKPVPPISPPRQNAVELARVVIDHTETLAANSPDIRAFR